MALTGSFSGTGASSAITVGGRFNLRLSGFGTATVKLERSGAGDGGTFHVVSQDAAGTEAAYTAACNVLGDEPGVALYRLNCTSFSSGPIAYCLEPAEARRA